MQQIKLVLLALAVSALSACSTNGPTSAAETASPSATQVAVAQEAMPADLGKTIIELEKKTWQMFNNNQLEELKQYYLPEYRTIYQGAIKSLAENLQESKDIVVKNFSMVDEKVTFPVKDTALLTYRYTADSTYKGKKTSSTLLASSVWVRIGGAWKNALYTESPTAPAK